MFAEPAPQSVEPKSQCSLIRHKDMFIGVEPDPTVQPSSGKLCWCVHTQKVLGPDGQLVSLDACTPDRPCFEAL